MKDILTYKGFIGSVHFSADDKVFHGKIEGIDDLVTFEGNTADGLVKAFHEEVDDYVELCKAQNKEPLRSYKGSLSQFVRAPVNGFFAPVYVSLFYEFAKDLNDARLIKGVEGQIGMVPVPHHTQ